ncbi:MAG: hypothetical protein L0J54_04895 [Halomonas sp.]|nr:hypothetical protein [Halomonas sp.]MDN6297350.1 hypothetical protein [Halomonas sp.]MDN6315590.1 hypothetical protein [Halomonas sp.]MDN6336247.1 hypothetical protein [Halomonas sp.]
MSESAASSRIVPDVDQSLNARHLRQPRKPRLWPLWLLVLVLIAAMAALAAGFWFERERLLGELEQVSGNVSNMHARLDSGDSDVQDKLALVQAQVSTLFQEQEQLAMHFSRTREELLSLVPASEDRVSAQAIEALLQQVKEQQTAASLRDDQLAALNASLDSLEKTAASEHEQLSDDMAHLADTAERRAKRDAAADEKRIAALNQRFNERLDALEDDITALEQSRKSLGDAPGSRLDALESDMRQIRQAQLAFSAQLEMLR